jgi:hypothetical protein
MHFLVLGLILGWNANVETNLVGYKLYQGPRVGIFTNVTTLGLVTNVGITLTNFGVYHFSLSAVNDLGQESDVSPEAVWTNAAPIINVPITVGLRWFTNVNPIVHWPYIPLVCDTLEWTPDLVTWTPISGTFLVVRTNECQVSISTGRAVRFFRVRRGVCVP